MVLKKIGILTSGGDCAGLNAIIRAATLHASKHYGATVYGVKKGAHGFMKRPVDAEILDPDRLDYDLLRRGGTFLGTTNKGNPFHFPVGIEYKDLSQEFVDGMHLLGLDGIIGIGGDGSTAILQKLCLKAGISFVAIPKTIDDDMGATDHSVGFLTAVDTATEALDKLHPTAASHDRVMVLEVMGRDAGHIALNAGIAGGADVILIPEIPYDLQAVVEHIQGIMKVGRNFALVVVAEAISKLNGEKAAIVDQEGQAARYAGMGQYIAKELSQHMEAEIRVTVLGHVQRGGQPAAQDRILAAAFGVHAVDILMQNKNDRLVIWRNREVTDVAISEGIDQYRTVDVGGTLIKTAKGLGICFG